MNFQLDEPTPEKVADLNRLRIEGSLKALWVVVDPKTNYRNLQRAGATAIFLRE